MTRSCSQRHRRILRAVLRMRYASSLVLPERSAHAVENGPVRLLVLPFSVVQPWPRRTRRPVRAGHGRRRSPEARTAPARSTGAVAPPLPRPGAYTPASRDAQQPRPRTPATTARVRSMLAHCRWLQRRSTHTDARRQAQKPLPGTHAWPRPSPRHCGSSMQRERSPASAGWRPRRSTRHAPT